MAVNWYNSTLIKVEDITPATRKFFFRMDDFEFFDFTPGQFVTFDLPIDKKPAKRLRSYSIASAPNGTNIIELVIVLVEDGRGTNYLFFDAPIGTQIPYRGPLGKFVLPDALERDICFICTGTGIAPFRSMLIQMHEQKRLTPDLYLIFGTRTKQDILYYDQMIQLAQEMEKLHYHVALSRESAQDWDGEIGYVHQVYERLFADKRPADFYLCGWTNMIQEARQRLEQMGYDRKSVHVEIYG